MNKTSYQTKEWTKHGFQNFIVPEEIDAPYTTIINRAKVKSPSIKGLLGIERIQFSGINLLNEFGSNGEQVYEPDNKDSRIRFCGGWINFSNAQGTGIYSSKINDYVEISFYGTGLNILVMGYTDSRNVRATIDNGAEGGDILFQMSDVLAGRNYAPRNLLNVASGLSLGWHTIRLRVTGINFTLYGIEILNEHSQLKCSEGSAFNGMSKETLSLISNTDYNAGVVGTKGARVVKYIKDGLISQAITEVPSSPSYLANTDHSNEDVVRMINFREFGANRSDDFSTLTSSTSSRVFTLDDGTTTLVGYNVHSNSDYIAITSASGNFLTITFVGTGLDVTYTRTDLAPTAHEIYVDGISQGAIPFTITSGKITFKLCSGLPYGTHTVKINRPGTGYDACMHDFIIYQPKKPTIPEGAVEIADYNVMANFVANPSTGLLVVDSGVLVKMPTRECVFSGSWSIIPMGPSYRSGYQIYSRTVGSYIEYSFFGTGFSAWTETRVSNYAGNQQFTLNGSTNFSAYTSQFISTSSGASFTAATGLLNAVGTPEDQYARLIIRGLPLGFHKLRIALSSGNQLVSHALDIITPIHINHSSFKIGSLSLISNQNIQPIAKEVNGVDLSKAKAWLVFDQANGKILESYNIAAVLANGTGISLVYFAKQFKKYYTFAGSTFNPNTVVAGTAVGSAYNNQSTFYIRVFRAYDDVAENQVFTAMWFGELADE